MNHITLSTKFIEPKQKLNKSNPRHESPYKEKKLR